MRTKRPSKFNSSPYGRSSIDLGGIIGAAGGGEGVGAAVETDTAAIADVATATPFTDKNFDAGEVQRFKPKNPVRNFLSGGRGTDRANQLNVESQLNESQNLANRNTIEIEQELQNEYLKLQKQLETEQLKNTLDITNSKKREQEDIDFERAGQHARITAQNDTDFGSALPLTQSPLNNAELGKHLSFRYGNRLQEGADSALTKSADDRTKLKSSQLLRNFQNSDKFKSALENNAEEQLLAQGVANDANARFTSVPDTMTFLRGGKAIRAPRMGYDIVDQGTDPLTGLSRPPLTKPKLVGDWRKTDFNHAVGKIDLENPDEPNAINPNEPFTATDSPPALPTTSKVPRSTTLQAPSKPGFWNTLGNALMPADARQPKSPVLESQEEKRRRLLEASRGFFRGGN